MLVANPLLGCYVLLYVIKPHDITIILVIFIILKSIIFPVMPFKLYSQRFFHLFPYGVVVFAFGTGTTRKPPPSEKLDLVQLNKTGGCLFFKELRKATAK